MSHIQVELDAIHRAADVAVLAGISEAEALAGLVKLWAECFRGKTSQVADSILRAKFQGKDVGPILVDLGFLERVAAPGAGWRVKGTGRYTRAAEGQSKGGHAAKSNLIPGARYARSKPIHKRKTSRLQPRDSREEAERQPISPLGSVSALDPRSEIRDPKEVKEGSPPASPPSGWRELTDGICAAYAEARGGSKYRWGKTTDSPALKALRAHSADEEILVRFRRGLRWEGFPRLETVAQLNQHWNHFSTDQPAPRARGPDFNGEDLRDAEGRLSFV